MKLERQGDVALLRMNTGKANAIGPSFLDGLNDRLDEVGDAAALVLTGYEGFFSAGLDLPTLVDFDDTRMRAFISRFNATMLRVFSIDKPVVAAVNGHAVAGGCVLMMQADARLAVDGSAQKVVIGLNEVPLGIGLPTVVVESLRCQVPPTSLLPVALEGRLVAPPEALALGLVESLHPAGELLDRALERARTLAALPASAFASVKRSLRGPIIDAVQKAPDDPVRWTKTWFSPEGQARLRAAVAKLKK
jgi:enoyl-CoA hydratase